MRIIKKEMICPCCKKEVTNDLLASFNSEMIDEANEFNKFNEIKDCCQECKVKLVDKEYLKYYNKEGKIEIATKYIEIENILLDNQFNEIVFDIYNLCKITNYNILQFSETVEEIDGGLVGKIQIDFLYEDIAAPIYCVDVKRIDDSVYLANKDYYKNELLEITLAYIKFLKGQLLKFLDLQFVENK